MNESLLLTQVLNLFIFSFEYEILSNVLILFPKPTQDTPLHSIVMSSEEPLCCDGL